MALTRSTGGKKMALQLQPVLELKEGEGRAPSSIRLAAGWISVPAGWMLSAACLPKPEMKAATRESLGSGQERVEKC